MTSTRPLPYGRQQIEDSDIEAVVACLRGDWLTQGPMVEAFERALCEATGARHAVAVANGTAALHLACLGLDVGPGDIGITSAITFVASANCLRYVGADVAFADIESDSGLVCCDALEERIAELEAIGRPPKVLIPVDLAGQPVDLVRVRELADRCGARVLQDAAHSLGARIVRGEALRSATDCHLADAATLSFHPVKHVTTAEGGAIVTNDPELAARLRRLRTHGIHKDASSFSRSGDDPFVGGWYYEQVDLGFNYRIPDVLCALGVSQLKRLESFVARRRALAARYDSALCDTTLAKHFVPLVQQPGRQSSYHLYVIRLLGQQETDAGSVARSRRDLYKYLRARGVLCQIHYIPVPWQPYYRQLSPGACDFPGASAYYASCLSLPMFPGMQDADVDRVIGTLASWIQRE